ncbi:MAG: hypothetical protein WAN93_08200 [Solirubrobacteraceae bacterium]
MTVPIRSMGDGVRGLLELAAPTTVAVLRVAVADVPQPHVQTADSTDKASKARRVEPSGISSPG